MKTYIAITPLDLSTIEEDEIIESLGEFGCTDTVIDNKHYVTCKDLKALAQMMHTLDLPGSIVELTGIYDSKETETQSYIV